MSVSVADDMIRSFFERWRNLEAEKASISEDLRELFAEMKGNGFDTKVARKVFRDKTVDQNERAEFEAIYDLYWSALSGPRAGRAREGHEATTPNASNSGDDSAESDDLSTTPETEPSQAHNDVGSEQAAASIPPEVAAGNSEPQRSPAAQSLPDGGPVVTPSTGQGGDESPVIHHQSSDLHDGPSKAVPAPALDESRDSAAGVEAPAAPVNPRCLKHQRGEDCKFSHKRYSCAGCNQAAELQRAGAA